MGNLALTVSEKWIRLDENQLMVVAGRSICEIPD